MMTDNSPGFIRQLPSALPGLALIVATLVVIRLWVEPLMAQTVLFGIKGWFVQVLHLNYILLGIICGLIYRNVLFGGKIPDVLLDGYFPDWWLRHHDRHHGPVAGQGVQAGSLDDRRDGQCPQYLRRVSGGGN